MLVMLPCAGGCASNYGGYKKYIPDLEIYEYPGHWTRYHEALIPSARLMVSRVIQQICSGHNGSIFLFGHSMGGLTAWHAARELERKGVDVKRLFIAACNSPGSLTEWMGDTENEEDIRRFLRSVRQVPEHVLNSGFFHENLLPVIKNDFGLVKEMHQTADTGTASFPITCFCGENDPVVSVSDMKKWRSFTSHSFELVCHRGDHFFVYDQDTVAAVSSQILERMGE